MATPAIPTTEPTTLTRGDSTKWTRGFSDYLPVDGWSLKYHFIAAGGKQVVTATDNGDGTFLATLMTTVSKLLTIGTWSWQAVVTKGSEQITLDAGIINVVAGFAETNTGTDVRTQARRTLDAVNATLEGRASSDQLRVQVNGRSIERLSLTELRQWQAQLRTEVRAEELGDNAGLGRNIKVRYGWN